jgi:flagellar biosynthetic protein FliQ
VNVDQAVELSRNAVMITMTIGAPVMIIAVIVGLFVSILQAVTQLQDQTLSFVPKIVAMMVTMMFIFPWILNLMIEYSTNLFREISSGL